jgi:uncharacterized protein YqeY
VTVIEKLKTEAMRLRKERSPLAPSITFALSEIDKVGKNAGNRATTEDEAIRVIQKLVATVEGNIAVAEGDAKVAMKCEVVILKSVLPQMVSADEIHSKLVHMFQAQPPKNKGEVMKWAKVQWGASADMKTVGAIANDLWGV